MEELRRELDSAMKEARETARREEVPHQTIINITGAGATVYIWPPPDRIKTEEEQSKPR